MSVAAGRRSRESFPPDKGQPGLVCHTNNSPGAAPSSRGSNAAGPVELFLKVVFVPGHIPVVPDPARTSPPPLLLLISLACRREDSNNQTIPSHHTTPHHIQNYHTPPTSTPKCPRDSCARQHPVLGIVHCRPRSDKSDAGEKTPQANPPRKTRAPRHSRKASGRIPSGR